MTDKHKAVVETMCRAMFENDNDCSWAEWCELEPDMAEECRLDMLAALRALAASPEAVEIMLHNLKIERLRAALENPMTDTTTPEERAELRRLAADVRPNGKLELDAIGSRTSGIGVQGDDGDFLAVDVPIEWAAYIVVSANLAPRLCAQVEEQAGEIERLTMLLGLLPDNIGAGLLQRLEGAGLSALATALANIRDARAALEPSHD